MQRDAVWGALVMGSLQIAAVESIEGGLSTIRARFKALPLNQGKVANELRRRIVPTFVARGIKPYA
jgi:hypothetical protein